MRYDKRVADPSILNLIKEQLKTALANTDDPAVGVGLASSILKASRSYGIDGTQAIKHYLKELKTRPALREDLMGSLLAPGVDEAAVPVIDGMIDDESLAPDSQRLLRSLLKESKRKKQVGEEAIKQLKKHLENTDREELVDRATDALAVISETLPAEVTAPLFVQLLSDPSSSVRERISDDVISFEFEDEMPDSIKKLLRAGTFSKDEGVQVTHFALLRDQSFEDESLIPSLKKILKSDKSNDAIRAGALWAASRLPSLREEVVAQATALASAENEDVSRAAFILLLSSKGPEKTGEMLAKSSVETRVQMLSTMVDWLETDSGQEKGGEALACLLKSLQDKEDSIKKVALGTLAKIEIADEDKGRVLSATRLLQSQKGEVGTKATITLLALAPTQMPKKLVAAALKGEDTELASKIIDSLVVLAENGKAKQSANFMVPALLSEDESIRDYAIESLSEMGASAHDALELALKTGSNAARIQALNALAKQKKGAQKLAPPVTTLLASSRPDVARAAVRTLGLIGAPKVNTRLRELARRSAPRLRAECWIALGRLGAKDSGQEIERLLVDGGIATESEYLASSLLQIDQNRGLRYLTGALRTRYGRVPATVAARLLGALGGKAKAVLPDLEALKEDPNPQIRTAAKAALLRIAGA